MVVCWAVPNLVQYSLVDFLEKRVLHRVSFEWVKVSSKARVSSSRRVLILGLLFPRDVLKLEVE